MCSAMCRKGAGAVHDYLSVVLNANVCAVDLYNLVPLDHSGSVCRGAGVHIAHQLGLLYTTQSNVD